MGFRTFKDGALNRIWLGAILAGIQNLNEASTYSVFNATDAAFTNVVIYSNLWRRNSLGFLKRRKGCCLNK